MVLPPYILGQIFSVWGSALHRLLPYGGKISSRAPVMHPSLSTTPEERTFFSFFFSLAKSSGLPGVDKPGPMTWPLWNLKLESISPNLMEQEWWQGGVGN